MATSTIYMSALATLAGQGDRLTVDANDAATLSTASNVSVLKSTNVISTPSTGGVPLWRTIIEGHGNDQIFGVSNDPTGNVVVTGYYSSVNSIVYNANDTTAFTLRTPSSGTQAAFVVKYSTTGAVQWGASIDGDGTDQGWGVNCDSSGNIIVIGQYVGSTCVAYNSSGAAAFTLRGTTLTTGGANSTATYIIKYNSIGTPLWGATIDGNGQDWGQGVACDVSGNIAVTGFINGTACSVYNGSGTLAFNLTASSNINGSAYIIKYSPSGAALWGASIDGTGSEYGYAVCCDPTGSVFVTGYYDSSGCVVYNGSGAAAFTLRSPTTANGTTFIVKYSPAGIPLWNAVIDGSGFEQGLGITCDVSGNVLVNGLYNAGTCVVYDSSGAAAFTLRTPTSSSQAAFLAKYNSNGTPMWCASVDGAGVESGRGVSCDSLGNVYAVCNYNSSGCIVYNGSGTATFTLRTASNANSAACVVKYSPVGTPLWSAVVDGTGSEQGYSISCDTLGNVYLTGYYNSANTVVYNSSGASALTFPASVDGNWAAFLVKYTAGNDILTILPYTLPTANLTASNTGFRKLLYHAPNSNAATTTVNVTNPSGTTLSTYTIGQGSNVSLVWVDTQWLRLA